MPVPCSPCYYSPGALLVLLTLHPLILHAFTLHSLLIPQIPLPNLISYFIIVVVILHLRRGTE